MLACTLPTVRSVGRGVSRPLLADGSEEFRTTWMPPLRGRLASVELPVSRPVKPIRLTEFIVSRIGLTGARRPFFRPIG